MSRRTATENADSGREAWTLILDLFRSCKRSFATIAGEAELGPSQLQFLLNINPERPSSMGELAEILCCDASYVTSLVDKLEARGLLERRPSPGDRRVKLIALTDQGESLRAGLLGRVLEPPPQISNLPQADRDALRDILSRALAGHPPA